MHRASRPPASSTNSQLSTRDRFSGTHIASTRTSNESMNSAAAWSPPSGLVATAGELNRRSPCCWGFGGCGSATSAPTSASSPSPCWPARRSCSRPCVSHPGDRSGMSAKPPVGFGFVQTCVTTKLSNSASTAFSALWAFVPAFTPRPTVPVWNGFCVSVTSATT